MSATSFSVNQDNSTDAAFRAWGSAVSAQIAAAGLVQTADTGQVNWTTATRSGTAGANYEIWRFNDALQATLPIFIKLEYVSTNGVTHSGLAITVGFATNGAGAITGTQSTPRWGSNTSTTAAAGVTCLISGASSRLALAVGINAASVGNTHLISVERSKDATGADTAAGVIVAMFGNSFAITGGASNNKAAMMYVPASGGLPSIEAPPAAILSNAASGSSAFGTTIGMGTPIPLAGSAQNPGTNLLVHLSPDFTRDTQHSVALYGTNRNYYIVGPNLTTVIGAAGTPAPASRVAMRFD